MDNSNKNFFRLCTALDLILIAFLSIYGREITNRAPILITIIPYLIGTVCILGVILGYKKIKTKSIKIKESYKNVATLTLAIIFGVLLIEYLIVLPIERAHFAKFSLLAFFVFFSLSNEKKVIRNVLIAFCFASAIGIFDESLQIFKPDRFFDYRDILINLVSAFLGSLYAYLVDNLLKTTLPR